MCWLCWWISLSLIHATGLSVRVRGGPVDRPKMFTLFSSRAYVTKRK